MKKFFIDMRWFAVIILVVMGGVIYRDMISYTMMMFSAPIEDMSHGWIVPFVSAYAIWHCRKALREAAGQPSWRGFLWVCLFAVIGWFGGRGGQSRLEQVSLIGLIWAVPYTFWGGGVARLMLFPASFLVFTIPMSSFTDFFTIHLRIIASSVATAILNGVGQSVEQSGTALFSKVPGSEFNVDVADPCSGIRSLFAMISLTATYAYFTQKSLLQKWALFVCAVPLAIVGNIFRILSICLVASWFGQELATGYYHDYSGYVVFLVGVLLMIKAGQLIEKGGAFFQRLTLHPAVLRCRALLRGRPDRGASVRFGCVWVFGTLAMVTVLLGAKIVISPPVFESADFIASVLPEEVSGITGAQPWFCHNEQCLEAGERRLSGGQASDGKGPVSVCPKCGDELFPISLGEMRDLPKDTVIRKCNYHTEDGRAYNVSVVVAGRQRNSIHRAELCLPAQGFVMLDAKRVVLRMPSGKRLAVRQIVAQHRDGEKFNLIYWFVSANRENCSHTQRILTDVWDRSIHNRINRWVMIAVNVSPALESSESVTKFEAFLAGLSSKVIRQQ